MLREVTIEEYWPLIVKNTAEFQQIAVAENPEFNKLAECIYRVLGDGFIADATEYGVERWEKMLGITPAEGSSLDDRKAAILTQLSVKIPYTWRVLKQMLVPILGGEDKFVMKHLNDTAQLIVHTDRLNDAMLATVNDLLERVLPQNLEIVQYNHHIEVSWRDVTVYLPPDVVNKYDNCTTVNEIEALNPDYKNDLTSDGGWGYALFNLKYGSKGAGQGWNAEGMFKNSLLRKFGLRILPKIQTTVQFFSGSKLEELELELPMATNVGAAFTDDSVGICTNCAELKHAELTIPKASIIVSAFYNCPKLESLTLKGTNATNLERLCRNNKSLSRFWINSPNINKAKLAFHLCILNKESTLHILQKLVTYTDGAEHPITLGIHIDHQNDEEVLAAISNAAEAKGWTLTVQWNGTQTSGVSTLDLDELWCKVTESENGDYTDENGNRCTLEWGHMITSPEGKTPSEMGYKLFFSLVEAEQYFKLTRIENNE